MTFDVICITTSRCKSFMTLKEIEDFLVEFKKTMNVDTWRKYTFEKKCHNLEDEDHEV